MHPISAHDVAAELRRRLPQVGDLKVHKLLYYAQGWHLAWTTKPLFGEAIEAWANGPVVAKLWHDESKKRPVPSSRALGSEALGTIGYVVSRYGRFTGPELIHLTHAEPPWLEVSERNSFNQEISLEVIEQFFRNELNASPARQIIEAAMDDPEIRSKFEGAATHARSMPATKDDPDEILRRIAAMQ